MAFGFTPDSSGTLSTGGAAEPLLHGGVGAAFETAPIGAPPAGAPAKGAPFPVTGLLGAGCPAVVG